MLRGLAATGGVITSAGILLAAVFAVLGVLPLVVLAQIGVIICVGVLLDTLVVRTLLVPAIAVVLGDRFWWPRRPHPAPADSADNAGIGIRDASPEVRTASLTQR
jgi:RND superfamily putative drug exporter